jgi:hypothetical protein
VALAVLAHYEGLALLSGWLSRVTFPRRRKVLLGVYGVILLHVFEILMFGTAMWAVLGQIDDTGSLNGEPHAALLDSIYLSASAFTTVGFGDVVPVGPIRFLSATESLIGFILITWSASFLYLEMDQYWHQKWHAD